jgi:hypothetical protein
MRSRTKVGQFNYGIGFLLACFWARFSGKYRRGFAVFLNATLHPVFTPEEEEDDDHHE